MRSLAFALLVLASCGKLVTYEPPPEKRQLEAEHKAMEDAKGLAAKNDLIGAHAKLSEIAIGSPIRTTTEYRDIQDRWAKERIAAADAEKDNKKKLEILREVSDFPDISGELRSTASTKAAAATPDPLIPPPSLTYDPVLAAQNMEKVQALLATKKVKDARDLLTPRVYAGKGSPEEVETLKSICVVAKDQACIATLADAGLAPADALTKAAPRR